MGASAGREEGRDVTASCSLLQRARARLIITSSAPRMQRCTVNPDAGENIYTGKITNDT